MHLPRYLAAPALAVVALAVVAFAVPPRSAPTPVAGLTAAQGAVADSVLALDAARTDSVARLGYLDGVISALTSDAVYLRAAQPMTFGRDNVARMLAAAPPPAGTGFRWQPVRVEVSHDRIAAYTVGIAAMTIPAQAGAPTIRLDRYIAYWRRETATAWHIAAYVEVGPPPAAAPPNADAGRPPAMHGTALALAAADSVFSALSVLRGTEVAFPAFAAPDAMVFGGSRFVVGPEAIGELHAGPDGGVLSWHAVTGDAAATADLGFTVGEYAFAPSSGSPPSHGKYLTIWAAQAGGVWRYVADGGNQNPVR